MFRSKILGTGSYLPEKLLTNKDLEKLVDTSDDWIYERTGIRQRHIAADGQDTSDVALKASQIALKEAGVKAEDLDLIIFATVTPDNVMPSTACTLQEKLGAANCMAFDLTAACSGFIYSLSIADQFIKLGTKKNILVVGAEVLSRFVDYEDRSVCILFGDGAGAAVVGPADETDKAQIYSHHMHADGSLGHVLRLPAGGSQHPPSQETLDKKMHYVTMNGREIFKHAVRTMSEACNEVLDHNKMSSKDVDWLIPHQANLRIIQSVAKRFDFPTEKVVIEIENMGNTSAATVPVAFDKAIRDGRIKRGQNVLMTAFGGGLTSGSLLMKY